MSLEHAGNRDEHQSEGGKHPGNMAEAGHRMPGYHGNGGALREIRAPDRRHMAADRQHMPMFRPHMPMFRPRMPMFRRRTGGFPRCPPDR